MEDVDYFTRGLTLVFWVWIGHSGFLWCWCWGGWDEERFEVEVGVGRCLWGCFLSDSFSTATTLTSTFTATFTAQLLHKSRWKWIIPVYYISSHQLDLYNHIRDSHWYWDLRLEECSPLICGHSFLESRNAPEFLKLASRVDWNSFPTNHVLSFKTEKGLAFSPWKTLRGCFTRLIAVKHTGLKRIHAVRAPKGGIEDNLTHHFMVEVHSEGAGQWEILLLHSRVPTEGLPVSVL